MESDYHGIYSALCDDSYFLSVLIPKNLIFLIGQNDAIFYISDGSLIKPLFIISWFSSINNLKTGLIIYLLILWTI